MVRSLRLSSFALVASVALFGWGCGGSSNNPPAPDGGTGDRPHIQLDGPNTGSEGGGQHDSAPTQQDGGGGNTCNPSGGNATAGLCSHFNSDCQCPNDCVNLFYDQDPTDKSSGSCWPQPDPTNGCADGNMAVTFSSTDVGHCYPEGTITGTFTVPFVATLNAAALGGTVAVTATVGGQTVTYTRGAVIHSTSGSSPAYVLALVDAGTTSINVLQIIIPDANYVTTSAPDMNANTFAYNALQSSTATTINFIGMTGTIPLTTAGTTVGTNAVGSFSFVAPATSAVIIKYVTEICGTHSTPC
ncbi:MAG TPA: hypothetical protein VGQ83_08845 [Polyangia bacterium]